MFWGVSLILKGLGMQTASWLLLELRDAIKRDSYRAIE